MSQLEKIAQVALCGCRSLILLVTDHHESYNHTYLFLNNITKKKQQKYWILKIKLSLINFHRFRRFNDGNKGPLRRECVM